MNRILTAAVVAGGLMLLISPEATAHRFGHNAYPPSPHYYAEVRRAHQMPRWLKRDQAFRFWYRSTPLRRDRSLAWHELFEIFRWERRRARAFYNGGNYWNDFYPRRYGERHHDRDDHRDRRHRH